MSDVRLGHPVLFLGKYFGDVLGVDFSQNFIDAANTVKEKNILSYSYLVEGDSYKKLMLF